MKRSISRRRLLGNGALAAAAAVLASAVPAEAAVRPNGPGPNGPGLHTIVSYDFSKGETAESIAIAGDGTSFVSLAFGGQLDILPASGSPRRVRFPGAGQGTFTGAVALDRHQRAYVPVNSPDGDVAGIWRVTAEGRAQRIAALPAGASGNGISFDARGNLYVADSVAGLIYRLRHGGSRVEVWLRDPLLDPDPGKSLEGVPFPGANGVQVFRGAVYVANSAQSNVLRIPIRPDGRPGPVGIRYPGVIADDFAFDVMGNLYTTTDPFDTVNRISPDGTTTVLATRADGLDGPSSVAFGVGRERATLYITNLGLFGSTHRSSVQKLFVGIPGAPRGR